jgi:hypothetical protein
MQKESGGTIAIGPWKVNTILASLFVPKRLGLSAPEWNGQFDRNP